MLINKVGEFEHHFCEILAKLAYHLHPQIIEYIQVKNREQYEIFSVLFDGKIKIENYLFEGSACVFPGVRRWVRGKGKYHRYDENYNAIPDDNLFPRHIWSFLINGIRYTGPAWKRNGLNQFELAHIFTHKESELNLERKFFREVNEDLFPYGDFTCASNVVLLPKGVVRPTDNSTAIKSAFYARYIDLYGETPLNGRREFKYDLVPNWCRKLEWNEPLLPENWQERIDTLIDFRNKTIRRILAKD